MNKKENLRKTMAAAGAAPVITFKNYRPAAQTLKAVPDAHIVAPKTAPSLMLEESLRSGAFGLESKGAGAAAEPAAAAAAAASSAAPQSAAAAAASAAPDLPGGSITIAPRKPNWDLKRDAQKKLDILDRATDRAIMEIVRSTVAARQAAASAGAASGGSGASAAAASGAGSSAAGGGGADSGSAEAIEGKASDELVFAVMSRDAEEIDLG